MYLEERGSNTLASILVNTNYEVALINLEIGGYLLFNANYETFQYLLPPSWTKILWEFCYSKQIEVPSNEIDLKLKREGDFFLMERFTILGFKKKTISSP